MPIHRSAISQLVVEGNNDRHVIWALCKYHNIPEVFTVTLPGDQNESGVDPLIRGIPTRLKIPGLRALGIVIDADENLLSRWQAIQTHLAGAGYTNLPARPIPEGILISETNFPRIGVWIMPNNEVSGAIEDFSRLLIAPTDQLASIATETISRLETAQLHRYRPSHRSKALLHTWLAWQNPPGMPMGTAITARVLDPESPLAGQFVRWLQRLFIED